MRFPFIGPSYESASFNADAQRAVNLYVEQVESGTGKNKAVFYGTPGLQVFATISGPVRGLWAGQGRLFAVGGSTLYEISAGGSATAFGGTIANDGFPAYMFPNGNQLFIVAGNAGYIHAGGDVVPAPVPADPVSPDGTPGAAVGLARAGCFIDSYFIASKPYHTHFFISRHYNGLDWREPTDDESEVWESTEYGTKEGFPDAIEFLLADHRDLWLFGSQTIEVWRNTGNPDFPFERDPGALIQQGTIAPFTCCSAAFGVCWLGGDYRGGPVMYRAQGFQPERISNHAVEAKWRAYSTVYDANAFTFTQSGHTFLQLNFPTANKSWRWDANTAMWHEVSSGGTDQRHRAMCHAFQFGRNLVGDYSSGNIYTMSPDIYTDNGAPITRVRTAPHIAEEDHPEFFHAFELDLEVNGSLPEVTMDYSDDGGYTWVTPKTITPSLNGRNGRVIYRRLGRSRDRIFRITIDDPVKIALVDAYLKMTGPVP